MPLTAFDIGTTVRFSFEKTVTGWASIELGENLLTTSLSDIDLTVWCQAYAAKFSVAGGGTTTIDLTSFTNLAGESVTFTKVFGLAIYVTLTNVANTNASITLKPGAANGLTWFFANNIPILANESLIKTAASSFAGVTVDGTHKNVAFANPGADSADVTVVILGRIT